MVAIIVPEQPVLTKWASEKKISFKEYSELLSHKDVVQAYLDEMKKLCKEAGFFGFEIPSAVHLTSTLFSVENDLLTPTFKLKRNEAKKFFKTQIKELYKGAALQGEEKI